MRCGEFRHCLRQYFPKTATETHRTHTKERGVDEKDYYNNTVKYDALDTDETLGRESIADTEAVPVEDIVIAHIMEEKLHHGFHPGTVQDEALQSLYHRPGCGHCR